ncbi:hypothetical protein NM688_g4883 [Phlebia brevispora]|uniref:Uncharacterized protein n=1 Tax=Phlebia brevispora TaxID=194682 RepID=A0ACC1T1M3_9APHY|nr:hypothetical protein NM688_g4883 [Phlebia brevispora]
MRPVSTKHHLTLATLLTFLMDVIEELEGFAGGTANVASVAGAGFALQQAAKKSRPTACLRRGMENLDVVINDLEMHDPKMPRKTVVELSQDHDKLQARGLELDEKARQSIPFKQLVLGAGIVNAIQLRRQANKWENHTEDLRFRTKRASTTNRGRHITEAGVEGPFTDAAAAPPSDGSVTEDTTVLAEESISGDAPSKLTSEPETEHAHPPLARTRSRSHSHTDDLEMEDISHPAT